MSAQIPTSGNLACSAFSSHKSSRSRPPCPPRPHDRSALDAYRMGTEMDLHALAPVVSNDITHGLMQPQRARSNQDEVPNSDSFPWKLRKMLNDAEETSFDHIVSWMPDKTAFRVFKPQEFMQDVCRNYFNQSRYKSFQRQLNMYGFMRINEGWTRGAYFHPLFVRDKPGLCHLVTRKQHITTKHIEGSGLASRASEPSTISKAVSANSAKQSSDMAPNLALIRERTCGMSAKRPCHGGYAINSADFHEMEASLNAQKQDDAEICAARKYHLQDQKDDEDDFLILSRDIDVIDSDEDDASRMWSCSSLVEQPASSGVGGSSRSFLGLH